MSRHPVWRASCIDARAATARATRRAKNSASIRVVRIERPDARADLRRRGVRRVREERAVGGEHRRRCRPGPGAPSTDAIAPENIQGWRCRSDFSRPGFSRSDGRRRQPSATPARRPTAKVTAPASPPSASIRNPERSAPRPVNSDKQRADREERDRGDADRDRQRARAGHRHERRERQQRADGERQERRDRRAPRRAQLVGIEPELLARQRVERVLGVGDDLRGELRRFLRPQSLRRVDERELLRLGFRDTGRARRARARSGTRRARAASAPKRIRRWPSRTRRRTCRRCRSAARRARRDSRRRRPGSGSRSTRVRR